MTPHERLKVVRQKAEEAIQREEAGVPFGRPVDPALVGLARAVYGLAEIVKEMMPEPPAAQQHALSCSRCGKPTYTAISMCNECRTPVLRRWEAEKPAWQPIETAPKNGIDIIIGCLLSGKVTPICWHTGLCVWRDFGTGLNITKEEYQPTHWMPMPSPPEK